MNLLLFKNHRQELFPVLESSPRHLRSEAPPRSSRWQRLKAEVKRYYQLLEEKLDYQERLCNDLRYAEDLKVHHASSLRQEEAQRDFKEFLKRRYKKHFRWLWIDGVLAMLGGALTPVPGPNVFFFYPAARTLGHYLAMKGAKKVLTATSFSLQSEPLIDEIQERLDELETARAIIEALEKRYNISSLEGHLRKLGGRH